MVEPSIHPASITVRFSPRLVLIPFAASPRAAIKKSRTSHRPEKPMPYIRPDFSAWLNFIPINSPKMVKIMGMVMVAPNALI